VSASQLTHQNLQIAFDFNVHGAFAAVQAVLPDMQARRSGTILLTTWRGRRAPSSTELPFWRIVQLLTTRPASFRSTQERLCRLRRPSFSGTKHRHGDEFEISCERR
jgi:NAD(P)-dependent dehydrogenase (short-subunit alcohol dehydrogenase family)